MWCSTASIRSSLLRRGFTTVSNHSSNTWCNDIDMDQLSPAARVGSAPPAALVRAPPLAKRHAAQNLAQRRNRHAGLPGDDRAAQTLLPRTLYLGNPLGRGAVAAALWRRTATSQCRLTATAVAGQPVIGRAGRQSAGLRRLRHAPALLRDPPTRVDLAASAAHSCGSLSGRSPRHVCECVNPQADRVPPDEPS